MCCLLERIVLFGNITNVQQPYPPWKRTRQDGQTAQRYSHLNARSLTQSLFFKRGWPYPPRKPSRKVRTVILHRDTVTLMLDLSLNLSHKRGWPYPARKPSRKNTSQRWSYRIEILSLIVPKMNSFSPLSQTHPTATLDCGLLYLLCM